MIFGPFSGSSFEVERTDGYMLEVLVSSNVRLERVSGSMSVSNTSSRLVGKSSLFILDKCDITAHTVLLYVLLCLTYVYYTLCILYILYTVHIVHVPCFPVSDVEVSPSTSVHTLVHT